MSRRQRRGQRRALGVGLAATVAVLALYAAGGLDWLELKTLDLRFCWANSTPEDSRIVCIDIDDGSLRTVGRWPWPRDVQAGILAGLAEAGARAILYDVTLVEEEPVRPLVPRQGGVQFDPLALAVAGPAVVLPDLELRAALAEAGNVYLALDYGPAGPAGAPESRLRAQVRQWLDEQPQRWSLPPVELFRRAGAALGVAAAATAPAGRAAPADDEALALAVRDVLGHAATLRTAFAGAERLAPVARPAARITPVYFLHAEAARGCGFVVFEPDADGVMRRMRLLVSHEGRVIPQLALAVALDVLGVRAEDLSAGPGWLRLERPALGEALDLPVDGDGRVLVPWVPRRPWTRQFGPRVPADAAWQVFDRRLRIRQNREQMLAALDELGAAGAVEAGRAYAEDLRRVLGLEEELRLARYRRDAAAVAEIGGWLAEYEGLLSAGEPAVRAELERAAAQRTAGPDAAGAERRALSGVVLGALEANAGYRGEVAATLARLRSRVAGKVCVVGYTATALADMTPIPTATRAPGVVAHVNLLNGLLTGRRVAWLPAWLNALLAFGLGGLATVMSVRWGPRTMAVVVLLVMAYVGVAGWLAFFASATWIALTPAVLATALAYVAVVVHRYVFLERESRQLARALGQYTSATLARQMAEDAELCRRAETREVTAMFTDLAGFTPLSEQIGAERTQRLLNAVLGRLSDVLLRQQAMVNKFLGDGIFAFWNPVIFPQPDHARRACAAAVELRAALGALVAEQRAAGGDEAFGALVLRVGVATGSAVVGPCGSEQKYDYTCIGDSVNVAARLESANKFYGTRVLVSGATRAQAGTEFVFRPLGGVRVKGKVQAVPIFELLGVAGAVAEGELRYAERFGQAVAAFAARDWPGAVAVLEACLRERPDDQAARRYLEAARQCQARPPEGAWSGALELAEK